MRKSRIESDVFNDKEIPPCQGEIKGDVRRGQPPAGYGRLPLILITIVFITITGCEESLDPLLENDRYFYSVNGYLDASADTQWVRIMPVRESIYPASNIPVPTVTLEDMESGESVIMQDSLFRFDDDRNVLNFWTAMEVHPGRSYQLTVEGPEGRISYAETTLPEDFPIPFFSQPEFSADILIIDGVERLADVQVVYRIQFHNSDVSFNVRYPHLQEGLQVQSSRYRIPIEAGALRLQLTEAYCNFSVIERVVFVASGGPGWPEFVSFDRHTIALPDYLSNIENGVGFFGGIISKTFPYIDVEGDDGLFNVSC